MSDRATRIRAAVLSRIAERGDMEIPVTGLTLASLIRQLGYGEYAASMLESGDHSYDVPARLLEVLVRAAEREASR